MPRKAKSCRTQQAHYNDIGRQLQRSAAREHLNSCYGALRLCIAEIEQFHALAYPDCDGGCPADEALRAARNALGDDSKGRNEPCK